MQDTATSWLHQTGRCAVWVGLSVFRSLWGLPGLTCMKYSSSRQSTQGSATSMGRTSLEMSQHLIRIIFSYKDGSGGQRELGVWRGGQGVPSLCPIYGEQTGAAGVHRGSWHCVLGR